MALYREIRVTTILTLLFFCAAGAYALYEMSGMIRGPRINIPLGTLESADAYMVIRGNAERISRLSMNGAIISVTEDGAFEEPYLLSPGLNRISFDAEDKYGRKEHAVMQVVYTPTQAALPPTQEHASSTDGVAPESP